MFPYLLAIFILVPLTELVIFIGLGSRIGLLPTLMIIFATGALGAWLAKSQGTLAIAKFRSAVAQGRLPHAEVVDGVMILIAGVLLLMPGFLTDIIGFLTLIPAVRGRLRGFLLGSLIARLFPITKMSPHRQSSESAPSQKQDPRVIDVEVVQD